MINYNSFSFDITW